MTLAQYKMNRACMCACIRDTQVTVGICTYLCACVRACEHVRKSYITRNTIDEDQLITNY